MENRRESVACLSVRVLTPLHGRQSAKVAVTAPIRETGKKIQREEVGEGGSGGGPRPTGKPSGGEPNQWDLAAAGGHFSWRYVSEGRVVDKTALNLLLRKVFFLAEISADCCLYGTRRTQQQMLCHI